MDDIWNSWNDEKKVTNNGMLQNILHYANKLQKKIQASQKEMTIKSVQKYKGWASYE